MFRAVQYYVIHKEMCLILGEVYTHLPHLILTPLLCHYPWGRGVCLSLYWIYVITKSGWGVECRYHIAVGHV